MKKYDQLLDIVQKQQTTIARLSTNQVASSDIINGIKTGGALSAELQAEVHAAWKEAQKYGTMTEGPWLDPATMFEDVYAEMPAHLESQRRRMLEIVSGE